MVDWKRWLRLAGLVGADRRSLLRGARLRPAAPGEPGPRRGVGADPRRPGDRHRLAAEAAPGRRVAQGGRADHQHRPRGRRLRARLLRPEPERPSQIAGLHTRLDSLYFATTTLATVGTGDVHAAGQVARALVLVQMIFNVVFVATIAALLSARVKSAAELRAEERRRQREAKGSSVPGHRGAEVPLEVEVAVVADVDLDHLDPAAGEGERRAVLRRHRVGAVPADRQPLTAEREVARAGSSTRSWQPPVSST